jgi:hypothetical protein
MSDLQDRRYQPTATQQDRQSGRSPELDLLLVCARWPQRRLHDHQQIRAKCLEVVDWQRFLQLVRHHRVVPLVSQNLHASIKEPPPPELDAVMAELRRLAAASAHQSMRSLAELRRILQGFHAQKIPVRVLKGVPLAQATFGDLSLRSPGDLDLLIHESYITGADRVLRGFGYTGLHRIDQFSPKRLAFYRSHWKDLAYWSAETGFEIDLHWRCFRNSEMPGADLCAAGESQSISFGTFRVETPPRMEGLLYLCVHGTLDGWLYFKSLVDVAAQVRSMNESDLDALALLAAAYGVLPELTATLTLVRRYLGLNFWSGCLLPDSDPTVKHILRYADRTLVGGDFLADRESIPISSTLAFELGLRSNFRYRYELLLRVLYRARMWETIPLPDALFGLYPLLSPIEWLIYRLKSKAASKARVAG